MKLGWIGWLSQHLIGTAMFFLTLVFISRLLRERRSPGSAIAWLLTIVLVPYVGIPLYLFFGWDRIRRRGPRKKGALYAPLQYTETPDSVGMVERLLLAAGAPARRAGNHLELVSDGVEAFTRLLKLIDGAKHEVHIMTFVLGRDEVADQILGALEQKARAGVKVRFLLDGFGALFTNHAPLKKLQAAGGQVATFLPIIRMPFRGRSDLRNHRKIVVIDGVFAMVGGMNLAREYMGPDVYAGRWDDLALHVQGPIVADLQEIFHSDWKFAAGESIAGARAETGGAPVTTNAKSDVQVVASGPDVASASIYDGLLTAVFEARSRIWIVTPYFIPDETLTRALELACRRGVDVRILIPARSNHLLADVGRGSFLRQIIESGAKILRHPKMVHAKATIIDDAHAIVGSANTDMRSFFFNYEVCVFLYSKPDIETVAKWFEGLAGECKHGYPKAAFGMLTLEGVSRILSPLL